MFTQCKQFRKSSKTITLKENFRYFTLKADYFYTYLDILNFTYCKQCKNIKKIIYSIILLSKAGYKNVKVTILMVWFVQIKILNILKEILKRSVTFMQEVKFNLFS